MLEEFIENAKLLVNTLGYKVFDKIDVSLIENNKSSQNIFFIKAARGADAKGVLVADGFLVAKGSKIAKDTAPSMSANLVTLRKKLIDKGIVDKEFLFVSDHVFTSPSLAAAVVMGRNANGRTEWKKSNGKSIKDIEEQ